MGDVKGRAEARYPDVRPYTRMLTNLRMLPMVWQAT